MAAQKGSLMLIKIGDGATPTEAFTTLAGIRSKNLRIGTETVDITNDDSPNQWRELLGGAGIKTMSASGSGVFQDATVDATLRTDMFARTKRNFELVVPDFGTFKGPFIINQIEYAGEHNGEINYTIGLESAGEITFTAAA